MYTLHSTSTTYLNKIHSETVRDTVTPQTMCSQGMIHWWQQDSKQSDR